MGQKPQPIAYHLTMPTAEGKSLFALPEHAAAAADTLRALRAKRVFRLFAFAVLPDRVELICAPVAGDELRAVLYALRLEIANALRRSGMKQALWAPRSEIRKIFDPQAAAALALAVQQLPVDAGLASNPESYHFSSAHAQAGVDEFVPESSDKGAGEIITVPIKPAAVPA